VLKLGVPFEGEVNFLLAIKSAIMGDKSVDRIKPWHLKTGNDRAVTGCIVGILIGLTDSSCLEEAYRVGSGSTLDGEDDGTGRVAAVGRSRRNESLVTIAIGGLYGEPRRHSAQDPRCVGGYIDVGSATLIIERDFVGSDVLRGMSSSQLKFADDANFVVIDGVVYDKDVTRAVFYPTDHDRYLRLKYGYAEMRQGPDDTEVVQHSLLVDDEGNEMEELWGTTHKYNEAYYQNYNREVRTYVIPSTVTVIGELAFAYSNIVDLYIPEGVTSMENMAIFKNSVLTNIFSYKTDTGVTDTTYKGIDNMSTIYDSLPEGLESIGSDCFYYERGLTYMYLPSTVTKIGHHAFWDATYRENKQLNGIPCMNVGASEEDFANNTDAGQQWLPQYDYMLFKKKIDVNYSAERESQKAENVHREYYWAVQWIINNQSDEIKSNSSYLVKDFNGDGMPELVLREYNEETKATTDTVLTMKYNYLAEFEGEADTESETFSKLDDNTQLDGIYDIVK